MTDVDMEYTISERVISDSPIITPISMTTRDTPEAALTAAIASTLATFGYDFPPDRPERIAAAILAAMSPDWCGHEAEIERLRTEMAHQAHDTVAEYDRLRGEIARLREALDHIANGDLTTRNPREIARAALTPALDDIHGTPTFSG